MGKNRWLEQLKKGLCICGRPLEANKTKCKKCNERNKAKALERYYNRKKQGLCLCGEKSDPGKSNCSRCQEKAFIRRAKHIDAGLCRCGNPPVDGHRMCNKCQGYSRMNPGIKKLYRKATKEEKAKYGNRSGREILKEYYSLFSTHYD